MTDADAAEWCATLGCESDPVDGEDYCAECVDTSPGLVDDPDAVGEAVNPAGRERETTDSPDTAENEPATGRSSTREPRGMTAEKRFADADFTTPDSGVWPPALLDREQWMGHVEKKPFAPWGDRNHPEADPDDDARWKWGLTENHTDGETVAIAEDDHRLDGRAFIQREDDEFAYVDGDDVRDPETGEVHPAFVAVLDRLGLTHADVSQSGGGAHAQYRGELPEGVKQAAWQLDDEPWGDHDEGDLPSVEVYAGKRVCVATGEHVPGTPTEVREWDADALHDLLDENDQLPEPVSRPTAARDEFDPDEYDPGATTAGETTDDVRDVFAAFDRIDPKHVAGETIVHRWNDDASTSDDTRAFSPTWGRNSNGTANVVNDKVWYDTGDEGGYGGPVVMALIDAGEMSHQNASPRRATGALWWRGVEALRGLGYDIPEYDPPEESDDAEPVAVLPNSPRARAAANGWDWMSADRGGVEDALTVDDARERTTEAVADAYERGDRVLIEALPTMGKSYGAVAAAADAGEPITMLTTRGNREQYDQIREWCDEHDLKAKVLPSFHRDCETANGEHDDALAETVKEWYRRGATGQDIHKNAEWELGKPLPCDGPAGARCSYKAGWQFDAEEYDVLIGNYLHAHVESVTTGRTVVFDEFPDDAFETALGGSRLAGAVTRHLKTTDALPFDDYADLLEKRDDPERRASALAHFDDHDPERDTEQAFATDGHAIAPLATYTILAGAGDGDAGRDLGNGWERATLPGSGHVGLFDRENGSVQLLTPPELDPRYTRGMVALDGTPTTRLWELAIGEPRLNHRPVLADGERAEYVRDTLGLNIVRTTEYVKSYNSEDHVNPENDAALLDAVAAEHGSTPALLTTQTAERVHENAGLYETDGDGALVGGHDRVSALAHYGDLKGSNRFESTRLGAIVGSNHYGDGFIQKWGAFAGERVERDGDGKGADLSYTGIGDDVHRHMTAHETLQAFMRFGRDGGGATVYVHTNTLPDWIEENALAGEGRVVRTYSDGERQLLDALDSDAIGEEWTTGEVADHPAVEITESQARRHLHRLAKRGYVDVETEGNGFVWRDDGLHRVAEHGEVELAPVELDELDEQESDCIARTTTYTWDAISSPGTLGGKGSGEREAGDPGGRVGSDGGDRPPHNRS